MNPRQAYFVPSRFSTYGEADVATVEAEAAPKPLPWDAIVGGASALLGIGDPRDEVTKYENRLRDLQYGTPAEKTAAMLASGALTIPGAIEKTENKLQESLEQAYQTQARDKLMTALLITGVVAGGMGVLWLGAKTYREIQGARKNPDKKKKTTTKKTWLEFSAEKRRQGFTWAEAGEMWRGVEVGEGEEKVTFRGPVLRL